MEATVNPVDRFYALLRVVARFWVRFPFAERHRWRHGIPLVPGLVRQLREVAAETAVPLLLAG